MVVSDAALPLAWTAVAFPRERFVWFALKDPKVLGGTVLWMSNRGRHYPPWSSRHLNVMGLEEVTANFHLGLAASAAAESNFRERLADLPDAGAGAAAGCQLYHGRGGDPGRVRPGGGDGAGRGPEIHHPAGGQRPEGGGEG